MNFFQGKNILIISVQFFNYEHIISKELIRLGATVDLFDERPSNSFYSKAIIRLKKSLYQRRIDQHFLKILNKIKNKQYDYFLLIKGEATPVFFLEHLKKNHPKIQFVYYTYDSFKNNPNGLENLRFFDRKFTFDHLDARIYNLGFRPLFFANEYANINENTTDYQYDLSFIGTAHSDRYYISQNIASWCKNVGLNMFNFYFSPSKILFNIKKIADKNFLMFDRKKISFDSLTHTEIITLYQKSKAILDINHPGQNGLTMRTFETLGAGRKLITTNPDVQRYPFYDPKNIFIIDRKNPQLNIEFFNGEFNSIEKDIYFAMSLTGWLKELFVQETSIWEFKS
ncbi:CgeB family protein [Pedobacter cryotolerans]|uniref:Lipopolysaccharide biosynthesis protein n=1 Tax=Pedobacter cryotolerans TaxID=2571270 RepID=A0A4U1CF41_9SPHI|nr:lipopolysaccharide biosynthesis protein [Pedobacter cryotolerans]TKC03500.1 lipopolysaccharide biosynthesis protein [Pedobacter cryotolerans]